jgi:hypothetical protein
MGIFKQLETKDYLKIIIIIGIITVPLLVAFYARGT